jgi:endonuclease/exonuclease/phosphatase family metal-dependent hydrolase
MALLVTAAIVTHGADRRAAPPASGRIAGLSDVSQTSTLVSKSDWSLRLATFNIHGGQDAQGSPSLERIVETIAGFDFVGLNEVRTLGLLAGSDQASLVAGRVGGASAFAPSETRWWRPRLGNALVANLLVPRWRSVPLPNTRGKAYRNMILADVTKNGVVVHALITHVDNHADHAPQLREVCDTFLALPTPAVLLGDLNTRADDPLLVSMLVRADVVDATVNSGADPGHIDWILLRGLEFIEAGVRDLGASDHPCLWAKVKLPSVEPVAATVAASTSIDTAARQ